MQLQHTCPECGEHDNIDIAITVYLEGNGEPYHIMFTLTCSSCNHQWQRGTDDFSIDENP